MKGCFDKQADNRLATIEGHIRGIRQMIKDEKDCSDILMQLSAVEASIKSLSRMMLKNHIEHCVTNSVKTGDLSSLERLAEVIDAYRQ